MTNDELEPRPPEDFCDYMIRKELGHGGMGVIYQADHKRLSATRVLKVLKPDLCRDHDFVKTFRREAQLAAQLSHPNIVTVHNTGECAGFRYIEMEFVDGISLAEAIAEKGKARVHVALMIVSNICDALEYAHNKQLTFEGAIQHGIIHRDIKPENIMIARDGGIRLTDFGIACCAQLTGHTDTGKTPGTPGYMSPEQLDGPATRVDHRTDIYSLGALLYELLSGKPAFFGIPLKEISRTTPKRVVRIAAKAMSYDPVDRYDSAAKMQAEIKKCLKRHRHLDPKIAIKNWAFGPKTDDGTERRRWIRRAVVGFAFILILCGAFLITTYLHRKSGAAEWLAEFQAKISRSQDEHKFIESYTSLNWAEVTDLQIQAHALFDSWKFKDCSSLCDSGSRLIDALVQKYADSTRRYYQTVKTRIDTVEDQRIRDKLGPLVTAAEKSLEGGNYDSTNIVVDLMEDSTEVLLSILARAEPKQMPSRGEPLRQTSASRSDTASVVPSPRLGGLEILCYVNTVLRNCEIIVDGQPIGRESPDTLQLEEGEYEIRLVYRTAGAVLQKTRVVTVRSGETTPLEVDLGDR